MPVYISKTLGLAFIRSGISLPSLQGHRTSLQFGWYSFPVPLREEAESPIPAAVGNRTRDHWVASPTH